MNRQSIQNLAEVSSRLMARGTQVVAALGLFLAFTAAPAQAEEPVTISLAATYFQNDHAEWVPTNDAEIQRMVDTRNTFRSLLEDSGRYAFTMPDPALQETINKGQKLGSCAGCEFKYGEALGVSQVAWIEVQKVSELILNLNVYIADVDARQMAFVKSVDLRGNADVSWNHAITYLVENYLLAGPLIPPTPPIEG